MITYTIVAGTRTFNDYILLERTILSIYKSKGLHRADVEIISGGARGADALGEQFAKKYGLKLTVFPADWNKYDKKAGPIRNIQMAEYAQENGILIAFWDGVSRGTKHMIDTARKYGLEVFIIAV